MGQRQTGVGGGYFFFDFALFLAAGFLAADFLAAGFFAADFLAAGFFAADFLADDFLAELFLATGTLPPSRRASESPMAIACLRLVTFFPDPLRSVPCLSLCISVSTLS